MSRRWLSGQEDATEALDCFCFSKFFKVLMFGHTYLTSLRSNANQYKTYLTKYCTYTQINRCMVNDDNDDDDDNNNTNNNIIMIMMIIMMMMIIIMIIIMIITIIKITMIMIMIIMCTYDLKNPKFIFMGVLMKSEKADLFKIYT